MLVEKDFKEFLRLLNKHKVKYCIIGAYAFAFYARPRYTKDIDILMEPSEENSKRVISVLKQFGFKYKNLTEADFSKEGTIVQLGYPPLRIDLLTSIQGFEFEHLWKNREEGKYGSQKVFFIGLKDLIKCKQSAGRPQDRVDLKILNKKLKV